VKEAGEMAGTCIAVIVPRAAKPEISGGTDWRFDSDVGDGSGCDMTAIAARGVDTDVGSIAPAAAATAAAKGLVDCVLGKRRQV
jgi:hypothetical protein